MRAKKLGQRGYTMIEVLIVIAIVGILAIVALPNLERWISRMRLNGATQNVASVVSNARKMSITNRLRYCVTFASDALWANNEDIDYLITVSVLEETDVNSSAYVTLTAPVELAGFTNNPTTELYKGISLEGDPTTTTVFSLTDNCQGMLFNNSGYLDNPVGDFTFACGGTTCAKLTFRNKSQTFVEQRSLWIDRGGNTRLTVGPGVPPPGP